MTKKICDRCGAVINPPDSRMMVLRYRPSERFTVSGTSTQAKELCVACAHQLNQWMEGK